MIKKIEMYNVDRQGLKEFLKSADKTKIYIASEDTASTPVKYQIYKGKIAKFISFNPSINIRDNKITISKIDHSSFTLYELQGL